MKRAQEKSIFGRYKPFWENGKILSENDQKIGFNIKSYAVSQIFNSFKQNNSALNEGEKKEFEVMIKELATEKKSLGPDGNCTQEEFILFLENSFANVDDEDRNGEITMRTSASFKLLGELVDVLTQWGAIPEEWNKKKKYCKFKAVDIFKSIKQGVQPKRGGPKEEEDDVNKELNKMIDDREGKNLNDNENINEDNKPVNYQINKVDEITKHVDVKFNLNENTQNLDNKDHLIDFDTNKKINLDHNFIIDKVNENTENSGNFNKNNNTGTSTSTSRSNTHTRLYTNDNQTVQNNFGTPNPDLERVQSTKSINLDYNHEKHDKNNKQNVVTQALPKAEAQNSNPKENTQQNFNNNASFLSPSYQVDTKISKKLDFKLPVKFKCIDYFRLCDTIRKHLDTGRRELSANKLERTLSQCELAYYYLLNVNK